MLKLIMIKLISDIPIFKMKEGYLKNNCLTRKVASFQYVTKNILFNKMSDIFKISVINNNILLKQSN